MSFHENVFWSVNCTLFFLPNLLHPNVNFITVVKVDMSNKKLYTRKNFWEKSCDHIDNVIYSPHLSRGNLKLVI